MKTTVKRESPAAITERQRIEYDRFGPWAYPVRGPDEMPPRFDPWYEELKDSNLMLKLPRPVERREAKPGSDLYERILAVGRMGITYLSFSQGEILRRDVPFGDIAAVRLVQELLYGLLGLDLADGSVISVVFNTVSADVFESFVDAVRRGCAEGSQNRRFSPIKHEPEPTDEDMLCENILRSLRRREPGLTLLAYQAPCLLKSKNENARRGVLGFATSLFRRRLDGCFLTAISSELTALVCGSGVPRIGKSKGYRYEVIHLPARPFRAATVDSRVLANGAAVHVLRLSSAGHEYSLFFEEDPSYVLASL
jgi:hypothetical protein